MSNLVEAAASQDGSVSSLGSVQTGQPRVGRSPSHRNSSCWPSTRMPALATKAARSSVDKGCIPRRSPSGANCVTPVSCRQEGRETIGKLSRDQAEIARLRRKLKVSESRFEQTEPWRCGESSRRSSRTPSPNRQTSRSPRRSNHRLPATPRRWRRDRAGNFPGRALPHHDLPQALATSGPCPAAPPNKLSNEERADILIALNSPRFVDLGPLHVYVKLLDEGTYLGSMYTFYRVFRPTSKSPNAASWPSTRPGPSRNWSRPPHARCSAGILRSCGGPVKSKYFDCCLMIDIHSRFIVGAHVHATESGTLAVEMMKEIFGIRQVVHADQGTSMTSKSVAALLSDLEVPLPTPCKQR